MCKAISMIMSETRVYLPPQDFGDHSHDLILRYHRLPYGLFGDRLARVEVTPRNGRFRTDDGIIRTDLDTDAWCVFLDEQRKPGWWIDDPHLHEHRARQSAKRYLMSCPESVVPGCRRTLPYGGRFMTTAPEAVIRTSDYAVVGVGDNGSLRCGSSVRVTAYDHSRLKVRHDSKIYLGDYAWATLGCRNELTTGAFSVVHARIGNVITVGYGSHVKATHLNVIRCGFNSFVWMGRDCALYAELPVLVLAQQSCVIVTNPKPPHHGKPVVIDTRDPTTPPGVAYEITTSGQVVQRPAKVIWEVFRNLPRVCPSNPQGDPTCVLISR